jgi:hypothetical protein
VTIMQDYAAVMDREARERDPFGGALFDVDLAKHTSIDLVDGKHEEELQHLDAQKKALETVVGKYPLLQQGLAEGWAEIRVKNGDLGIHYNGQRSVSAGAAETDVEKKRTAEVIGNHFSVDDHRTRRTFAKAADPVDGEELRDSAGF